LLQKDFIGRWFYKHLTDEIVDRNQAEYILGGLNLSVGCLALKPLRGKRSDPDSLWKISSILKFAKFDYERFYYSIQGHTIPTPQFLRLLGRKPNDYGLLEAMYRQGRLRPAELTEHACTKEKDCYGCVVGRKVLANKGLSLNLRWMDASVKKQVRKLRWNDRQLRPYLRNWRNTNLIKATPRYIMRDDPKKDVGAGLLKYAQIIIDNEVVNEFKRLARSDDLGLGVFNNGMCPEFSDSESCGWEYDDDGQNSYLVNADAESSKQFDLTEIRSDISRLISKANLTSDEIAVIESVDIKGTPVREYAQEVSKSHQRIHQIRDKAIEKLRQFVIIPE
jgi:DNA-directed RNA polymerase specialized sigma24 family protein